MWEKSDYDMFKKQSRNTHNYKAFMRHGATQCYCKQQTEGTPHTCSPWCEWVGHFLNKFCSLIIRLEIHFMIQVLRPGNIRKKKKPSVWWTGSFIIVTHWLKRTPTHCLLTSIRFLKGQLSITGYECDTEYRTD